MHQRPATWKAWCPTIGSLMAGTNIQLVVEDRSFCRDGMSAVHVNCLRYSGTSACSARHRPRSITPVSPELPRSKIPMLACTLWIFAAIYHRNPGTTLSETILYSVHLLRHAVTQYPTPPGSTCHWEINACTLLLKHTASVRDASVF